MIVEEFIQTAELVSEYERVIEGVIRLVNPLSQNQLNWRPSSRNWSVADCISHLINSNSTYLFPIHRAIVNTKEKMSDDFKINKYSFFGKLFIKMMEPPVRIKMKTPKAFSGITITNKNDLLIDFISEQKKFIAVINQAAGLDWTKIKITSPANKFFKFRLNEVFAIIAAHNRRHLWQAHNITQRKDFPRD